MSYQDEVSTMTRINRILISSVVAAWGAPVTASFDFIPKAVPIAALELCMALVLGLVTIDVLGRGLLSLVRRKLKHTEPERD